MIRIDGWNALFDWIDKHNVTDIYPIDIKDDNMIFMDKPVIEVTFRYEYGQNNS